MNHKNREETLTREILEAIESRNDVTQRHLARHVGVALGLANSYLKRCVRKGLVKIEQAPPNRYLYYLTPKGFAEKSRLTAEYLSSSFSFYRQASESCAEALRQCTERTSTPIGLYGASDLAEVAAVQALEKGIPIACLCDPRGMRQRFLDFPVVRSVSERRDVEMWILTDLDDPPGKHEALCREVGADRVVVPSILGFRPESSTD